MSKIIQCCIVLISLSGISQEKFKVYYIEGDNGYKIVADNGEYTPVSVEINFEIANLKSSAGTTKIIEVPALTNEYFISDLTVLDRSKAYEIGYNIRYNHGNHLQKEYDKDFKYYLPYKNGTEHAVSQGYDGMISHQGEYALDFRMPVGTDIYAARGGIVVSVEESFEKACTSSDCAKFNNFILIYHTDGTFAEYTHIKKDGSLVKAGDKIKQGQHIGQSGNVGWSTGPHLHFIVFFQRFNDRETLPTKFLVNDGKELKALDVGRTYARNYK